MRLKTMVMSSAPLLLSAALLFASTLGATTIATYPPGTVLENIAVAPTGDLFVTSILDRTIYQISPAGDSHVFGQVPGQLLGVAFGTDGTLVAAGGTSFYKFAPAGWDGIPRDGHRRGRIT